MPVDVKAGDVVALRFSIQRDYCDMPLYVAVLKVEERLSDDCERTTVGVDIDCGRGRSMRVPLSAIERVLDPVEALAYAGRNR